MPLSDWLSSRQQRRYTQVTPAQTDVPDGSWTKCAGCGALLHVAQMDRADHVCTQCGRHEPMTPVERIEHLTDAGSFVEWDKDLAATDPLGFVAAKTYRESLAAARDTTCGEDAVVCGRASVGSIPLAIGVMDFRFIGGSMGSVVGEKVARAIDRAAAERVPVLMVCASGGARMHEGMLSLMQMAKTAAALARFREVRRPYLSLLTDPTTGGVTASFATLADVILAEPGARIGFTGARVIEQTIREKLPKGFQTAEFMLEHGLIDMIVARDEQRQVICKLMELFGAGECA